MFPLGLHPTHYRLCKHQPRTARVCILRLYIPSHWLRSILTMDATPGWSSVRCHGFALYLFRSPLQVIGPFYCKVTSFIHILLLPHEHTFLIGIKLTATRIPGTGCLPSQLPTTNLAVSFGYSVVLDFVIVLLCASQILRVNTSRSQLLSLMYRDGLTCFIVACVFSSSCFNLKSSEPEI